MKLYELTQNHLNLMELLDNPETPKEMIEVALAEVTESIEVKIWEFSKGNRNYRYWGTSFKRWRKKNKWKKKNARE